MGAGAPLGAEAAGDFAEDHAGPQGTLTFVVGGGHIAASDEDKEITAAFADTRASCWPVSVVGLTASSRSSLRSRSARYWTRVVSLRSGRRRPMATARCSSL